MKKILVPLGGSKRAINTLQYAVDFASISGGKIYVVQAYEVPTVSGSLKNIGDIYDKKVKFALHEIMDKVDFKDVEVIKCTVKGNILDNIPVLEKELNIDLIIASARPVSKDTSLYLGPITGSFVKRTEIPIIIIPKGYKFSAPKKLMVGVRSGQLNHDNILDPITELVKLFGTKVSLVHIVTPLNTAEDNILHEDFKAIADEIIYSENGTTFQGILVHLNQVNPDFMCVIRNKRGFFTRLLEANSIKKVDFESRVPLLVLRGNL